MRGVRTASVPSMETTDHLGVALPFRRWRYPSGKADAARIVQALAAIVILNLLPCAAAAQALALANGTIVDRAPCEPFPVASYEQYVDARKTAYAAEVEAARQEGFRMEMPKDFAALLVTRDEFAKRKAYAGFQCQRIKYMSDGLKVAGYIWKPTDTMGRKLPLIIFNRGGNREFGKVRAWTFGGFYDYLTAGFVVVASQYRGNDGGEGREEFGGADVRDVTNLIALAEGLDYVDSRNVFLFGWSRGAMMTLLAIKAGMPVNAAAVGGAPTDLTGLGRDRSAMVEQVYRQLIPDFDKRANEAMHERSAVYWAEKLDVPLLILHGGADWRVKAGDALALAHKLQALGKTYELIVYAGDNHWVSLNSADADRRTIAWFKRHMR